MATPAGFEPATYRLEGGCSIQLSYGATERARRVILNRAWALMRPLPDAIEAEIVRIGHGAALGVFRLDQLEWDAVLPRKGNRLFLAIKGQFDLLFCIGRACPTHEGLNALGLIRNEIEHPTVRFGIARLHRVASGPINARGHDELR